MKLDDVLPDQVKDPSSTQLPWSERQLDIFAIAQGSDQNLSIEAVAGSGKTTTILECMRRLPRGSDVLFLAFNKAIVNTLSSKIPPGCDARTMNALGHGLLMRKLKRAGLTCRLNSFRLWDETRRVLSSDDWEEYGRGVVRLVSLARQGAVGINSPIDSAAFHDMLGDFEVDIPDYHAGKACQQAARVLANMLTITDIFDFDDQLYMPLYWDLKFPKYDCVFVDEAQDLSTVQHIMLERLRQEGARIIAVGDSCQAIYGFRGADTKSMTNLAERFDMKLLPLDISYRCPISVVLKAQEIVYHIRYHKDAINGRVEYLDEMPELSEYPMDSMILCRNNAPIFSLALDFLQDQLPCHVMSNFGKDLVKFVKSFDAKTTKQLMKELSKWREQEAALAESHGWWGKAAMINDKYDALIPFCQLYELRVQVAGALHQLLNTNVGPTLSTIHKAKGQESENVYILRPDLMPARYAQSPGAMQQEQNLKYVAITRSLMNLTFLPEGD